MEVGEPAHCVPSNPIDVAAQLASLDVSNGRVRVRAGDGAHELLASVASNDIGLGRIVEAAMRSRFWKEMRHSARTTTQPDINGEVQS